MRPRSRIEMGIPLGFKIWFGLVGLVVLSIFAGTVYFLAQVVKAGPEGIGREVGSFIKVVKDASQ